MGNYMGDLLIPGMNFGIHGLQLLEFQPNGAPFEMLIGRDVLCRGTFTLSFDGHFSFAL
jgi:hypothetical protein